MTFSFNTEKVIAPSLEERNFDWLDLLNATDALNQAYMDLTDAQRSIEGIQEIMNNVRTSTELIAKYGSDAIPVLNADGGLESLLQIPEKLITIEKAQEGLGDAAKSAWNTFVEWIKKIGNIIKNFFSSLFNFHKKSAADVEHIDNSSEEDVGNATLAVIVHQAGINPEQKDKLNNDALGRMSECADKLFDCETASEERLKVVHDISKTLGFDLDKFHRDLDAIDWDKLRENLNITESKIGDVEKEVHDIEDRYKNISDDLRNFLSSDDILDSHATEAINIDAVNSTVTIIGRCVKNRCKKSNLKGSVNDVKLVSDAVVKFQTSLEAKIGSMQSLEKAQASIRQIERIIASLAKLDATIVKQTTRTSSKVANRLK